MPSKQFHVRYWDGEKDRWERRAGERGMSVSEWFRWLAEKDIRGEVMEGRRKKLEAPLQPE